MTAVESPVMGQLSRVLSPARDHPFDIVDSSMEEENMPPISRSLNSKGKQRAAATDVDEFDMDQSFDDDPIFLQEVDDIERTVMRLPPPTPNPVNSKPSRSPKKPAVPSFPPPPTKSRPQVAQTSVFTLSQRTLTQARDSATLPQDVITIDDDDDDDKENVPVPTRRVRRRISPSRSSHEVIDISD